MTVASTATELVRKIEEAESRVSQAATAEVRQVQDLLQRSRKATAEVMERLQALEEANLGLQKQLQAEQQTRTELLGNHQTALEQKGHAIETQLRQAEANRGAAEKLLRQELGGTLEESQSRCRAELEELRQVNQALTARVEELERPRGFRAFFQRTFSKK
jgi:hypothetical protein